MNPRPTGRRTRPIRTVVVVAVGALVAACGTDDAGESSPGGAVEAEVVRILTYDSYAASDEVIAEVRRKTGIVVEFVEVGDSAAVVARAALRSGQPEADVVVGIDELSLKRARSGGFVENDPGPAADVAFADGLAPTDDGFVPIQRGDVCVNADTEWFENKKTTVPSRFEDLARPEVASLLVVPDPAASSPGLAFLAGAASHLGDGFDAWLTALTEGGVTQAGSWDDAWNTDYSVNGGDRPLVVSYATSPPAEVIFGELPEPRSAVLAATCVRQVEYGAVLAGTPRLEAAQTVLAQLLSTNWQRSLPETNFVLPVVDGVEVPALFAPYAARSEPAVTVDASTFDTDGDVWLAAWADALG